MSIGPGTGSFASAPRRTLREAATEVWEWGPFIARRWKSIVGITVLTVAVAMVITYFIAPTYKSTASLVVQPLAIDQPFAYSTAVQLNARNVGELVKSPAVTAAAAKLLGKVKLRGKFEYRVLESSGLIQIINTAGSPQEAADEANAVATAFLASNSAAVQGNAVRVRSSLENQLDRLRVQITKTQADLAAARAVPNGTAEVSQLQDQLDALQTGYQNVLQETQVLPAATAMVSTTVIIADRAVPEPEPVGPKMLLNLFLSLAGGLLLGIAYARATEPRVKGPGTGA
jgi:uncharacterized protein involved in exopolysaccharide biosynthesis